VAPEARTLISPEINGLKNRNLNYKILIISASLQKVTSQIIIRTRDSPSKIIII
jgi:hypothetical protein